MSGVVPGAGEAEGRRAGGGVRWRRTAATLVVAAGLTTQVVSGDFWTVLGLKLSENHLFLFSVGGAEALRSGGGGTLTENSISLRPSIAHEPA